MNFEDLVTKKDLAQMKKELIAEIKGYVHEEKWLTTKETMKLLRIKSAVTFMKLRDAQKLPYKKFNNKDFSYPESVIKNIIANSITYNNDGGRTRKHRTNKKDVLESAAG